MGFERIAELRIQEAMENGEFDNLSCKGQRIDLSTYFATPAHLRLGYSVLRSSGFVPEEVEILREIDRLKEEIAACGIEDERQALHGRLNDTVLKFNILREYMKRSRG